MSEVLDDWLPDPVIRSRHRRAAQAAPAELWDAATSIRLEETKRLGRLVGWRIPGAEGTYHELFSSYPFTVLDEGERHLVSGLCGRIWTLARDYPEIDKAAFEQWDEPGTVRVAFAHWVEPSEGGSVIHSEARVWPVDTHARLRLKAVWAVVGPFERLVGAEPLALAAKRAET